MNFDDLLKDAWQGEAPAAPLHDITARVRRRQWRTRLYRLLEVVVTVLALAVFGRALASSNLTPSHWLLMPFYAVFLPIAWANVLRAPRRPARDAAEPAGAYARIRLAQLRTGLRDLWLARATVWALLGYALLANAGALWLAGDAWRSAAWELLLVAAAWLVATLWVSRRLRRRWVREYRAVRRLAGV